jgi:phosphoenolpyruvate synthase/pyruvate phosphate dikinase
MRVRATIIAIAAGLMVATGANAVNVQETVEMITHATLTMKDGTTMPTEIVRMNGKMYVMMSVDDLPDYLHQQVLKLMPQ